MTTGPISPDTVMNDVGEHTKINTIDPTLETDTAEILLHEHAAHLLLRRVKHRLDIITAQPAPLLTLVVGRSQ